MSSTRRRISCGLILAAGLWVAGVRAAPAQEVTLDIAVQNQRFEPSELHAPANRPIVIRIKNNEAKPIEFESKSLRVEKVIAAKSQGVVRVRALSPGRYEFEDDFNKATRGVLVVQ